MHAERTGASDTQAMAERGRRPLVATEAVIRWASETGIDVPDGPLDDTIVERYLQRDGRSARVTRRIDLRGPATTALSAAFGPEPCRRCGGPGDVDYIDIERRTQSQRCRRCGVSWESMLVLDAHQSS